MRTLVVGDIHSGLKGLKQVLKKVAPKPTDQFIFLGDYVDGWSDAAPTISFLIEFSKAYSCVFIRGNHDYLVYRYLKHQDCNSLWLDHGGAASKKSYESLSASEIKAHLHFFQHLVHFHIDAKNRLFVHAGFTNLNGPKNEYFQNLVFWDRTLWEVAKSLDVNLSIHDPRYPKRLLLFQEIYIGHTPVTRIGKTVPVQFANLWNIDTGAAFKGPLSILDIETKEYWQSDPLYLLYPNEKGRN